MRKRWARYWWTLEGFLALGGIAGFVGLILTAPYRLKRITGFLDPWSDPLGTGYQIIQSLYAIGPGGLGGLGLGMSRQKYAYVPEPQTDFIFSILAEELGFIGGLIVLLLFAALVWRGMRVAMTVSDSFGSLLAVGVVGMVAIQVMSSRHLYIRSAAAGQAHEYIIRPQAGVLLARDGSGVCNKPGWRRSSSSSQPEPFVPVEDSILQLV